MNILFIIRYFYPFIGGTEKQALSLATQLAAKGVGVTIVTSRFQQKWPRYEAIKGVEVVRLFSPRIKVIGALLFLTSLAGYLIRHRRKYSLIHTFQIGYTSTISIAAGMLLEKPTLLKLASSGSGGDIQRAERTPWGRLFLFAARKASRVIAVSRAVEEELLAASFDPARLSPISNGVAIHDYNRRGGKSEARRELKVADKRTLIYTGRLSPEKGVDFLVRSFSRVKASLDCQLLILADGPEKNHIRKTIKRLGLADAVLLIPAVDDVVPYLHAADLFILPSAFEGLSNSLLEAMACGLPVISTSVGGSADCIEDGVNGLLVEYSNEDHLSGAIAGVLGDAGLAARLGRNARETVEKNHAMDTIADRYLKLYRTLQYPGDVPAVLT